MRGYSFRYFLAEGFNGLWRNGFMSLASVAVLTSCLVVLGAFSTLVMNINFNLELMGTFNQIVTFLEPELTDERLLEIRDTILAMDNVSDVKYISREDAYNSEKEKYSEYPELFATLENDNMYPPCFVVSYVDVDQVPTLQYNLKQIEGIYKISHRSDISAGIQNFKSTVIFVCLWFLILLLLVSLFVIINTINIAIFSRRQEIGIMRYIGATNWFISVPFIIEGVLIGLISAAIAYVIDWNVYRYIENVVSSDIRFITVMPFPQLMWILAGSFAAIGFLCGAVGSLISIQRYMKA